jgi:hypothetical protein
MSAISDGATSWRRHRLSPGDLGCSHRPDAPGRAARAAEALGSMSGQQQARAKRAPNGHQHHFKQSKNKTG